MWKDLLAAALCCCFSTLLKGQEVVITSIEMRGGEVMVHYNLSDPNPERRFTLNLYSSEDNYIQPLNEVRGDVGIDIPQGQNKIVTWNAQEELGVDFNGKVALELKGNVYIPFITLDGFESYGTLKRGKPYQFSWSGGRGDNVLMFELYRGETRISVFEERPNVGNTELIIPTDVSPGSGYRFKVSDTRNREEVVYSGEFSIKRKYPLALKVLPVAALGGLVVVLMGDDGAGSERLADPPDLE